MGRARRKDRRSRASRKGSNSPRNSLDRDDDYLMHDSESSNSPSFNQHRERRQKSKRGRNNSEQMNRDDRNPKNRNTFGRFTNPFEKLDQDESTFHEEQQGSKFRGGRGQNRNRGGKQGHRIQIQQHNHHNGERNLDAALSTTGHKEDKHQNNDNGHNRKPPRYIYHNRNKSLSPSPQSSSPAPLARFCTECSTVRRANLKLRDWLSSAILRASEVLDSWSDEVGVGRGAADEMDWQPEPVVRVLILAATTSTTGGISSNVTPTPSTIEGTGGWVLQQQQQQHAGLIMGGEASYGGGTAAGSPGADANRNIGSWRLRPGTLNPGFPMGNGNSGVWEIEDSAPPGNASAWDQTNYGNSWDNPGPGPGPGTQSANLISPPETPPESPPFVDPDKFNTG